MKLECDSWRPNVNISWGANETAWVIFHFSHCSRLMALKRMGIVENYEVRF